MEDHKKAAIKEIEETKTDNPRIYWKLLKKLNGRRKRKDVWDTALNNIGEEMIGEEMRIVWKEAYRKL